MEGSESEKVLDSLNLNPQLFVNDSLNLVDELLDEAFDYFLQTAADMLKTEGTHRSEELRKGVYYIRRMIQATMEKKLSVWENYCLRHCFAVPEGLSLPKADVPSSDASSNFNGLEDPELDAKLDSLRNKLSQVSEESAKLNRELQALEKQSMLRSQSAASLTEVLELYQQQSVNEKFEELMQLAPEFYTKLENLKTRRVEDAECLRVKRIHISNGDVSAVNSSDGKLTATLEELAKFEDVMKAL